MAEFHLAASFSWPWYCVCKLTSQGHGLLGHLSIERRYNDKSECVLCLKCESVERLLILKGLIVSFARTPEHGFLLTVGGADGCLMVRIRPLSNTTSGQTG